MSTYTRTHGSTYTGTYTCEYGYPVPSHNYNPTLPVVPSVAHYAANPEKQGGRP